jgi:NAD(P)-dependent dehydrogenase (short-subunit alcohol dehydrogenase family)
MSNSSGQVAVVTGAGRGIGAHLARALAQDGFSVGLVGRTAGSLEEVAAGLPTETLVVPGDVTDPADVASIVEAVVAGLGPIDVLVNNAGVRDQRADAPWLAERDDWWRTIEVNLRGVMLMTSAVLPAMLERGSGRVIDLGSGMGQRPVPRYSGYSVSKAAALRWLENVAAALGDETGVRVVSVSPGVVRTDMTEAMFDPDEGVEFGDVGPVTDFVRRFAAGELDHLHGQFVHAVNDDY